MDAAARARSIAHAGSSNVAHSFGKLDARKPISLGVFGASVAQNAGCLEQPGKRCMLFNGLNDVDMSWGTPTKRPFKGFAVRLFEHINATWPHSGHRLSNGGVDKTAAQYQLDCLMTHVPAVLDLVLLEFGSMARYLSLYAIEGIVRLLATMPSRPVLILLSIHSWCLANFVGKAEAETIRVCNKYGFVCLSQKRALQPLVHAGKLSRELLVGRCGLYFRTCAM